MDTNLVSFFMAKRFFPSMHPHGELLGIAVQTLLAIRPKTLRAVRDGTGLGHPTYTAPDGTSKQILTVDQAIEDECAQTLIKAIGSDDQVRVLGEETLWKFANLNLTKEHLEGYGPQAHVVQGAETRLVVIIDMIDGSDLVERNFGNWCSAMIFFSPVPEPQVLFSLIHHADGTIYGADEHTTFLIAPTKKKGDSLPKLKGPAIQRLLRTNDQKELLEETGQIAICLYTQKVKHFTTVPTTFITWAEQTPAKDRLRFYNFAGNPMMARLANGENIHAVLEHRGQHPHDAAPGAYIGLRAGAHLVDLKGNEITSADLAKSLMEPSATALQYVLASTKELATELAAALK